MLNPIFEFGLIYGDRSYVPSICKNMLGPNFKIHLIFGETGYKIIVDNHIVFI